MKFGLAVSGMADSALIEKIAIRAEILGYDSFFGN